jgi:predicted nucleic acid-binding protein
VIAIADAGPLIALAKINALSLLSNLYGKVLITPTVYAETVAAGQALGAPDADLLEQAVNSGQLEIQVPTLAILPVPDLVHPGEQESICLALELKADVLLADDLAARRVAQANFAATYASTLIKGTLGVIVSAYLHRHLTRNSAINYVHALQMRPDVWLNYALCDQVIRSLQAD